MGFWVAQMKKVPTFILGKCHSHQVQDTLLHGWQNAVTLFAVIQTDTIVKCESMGYCKLIVLYVL